MIDAFRDVQAAEQERDRLERQADAYANRVLAGARGEAAQVLEQAESYRAQVVNEAQGEASRFTSVLTEYRAGAGRDAPSGSTSKHSKKCWAMSTRSSSTKTPAEQGGQGVVPYLPLNELRRSAPAAAQGGN